MPIQTRPFDPAEMLVGDPVVQQFFLDDALATGDADDIKRALGTLVRAGNMTAIAKEVGISREGLRKALSPDGNPTLSTLIALSNVLKLRLFRSQRRVPSKAKIEPEWKAERKPRSRRAPAGAKTKPPAASRRRNVA